MTSIQQFPGAHSKCSSPNCPATSSEIWFIFSKKSINRIVNKNNLEIQVGVSD